MIRTSLAGVALAAAAFTAAPALAAGLTPLEIVNRHMAAGAKADVAAIVADYADDAVVLNGASATEGKAAIGAMYQAILQPGGPVAGIKPIKVWAQGDIGFVSWEAGGRVGTDSFLVKDGKIKVQAVFIGQGPPAAPPAK